MSFDRPTEIDVLEQVCADLCAGVRTTLVGVVISYNGTTRTAKVQPARRGRTPDRQTYDLPPIPDAPVLWPRFGGCGIFGRLQPGDPVLLLVLDRELDQWINSGAVHDPSSSRFHELTDAMVLPMPPSPRNRPVTVGAAGAQFYLGREDGSASVSISNLVPGQLTLESAAAGMRLGSGAVSPAVRGTQLVAAFTVWTGAVATAGNTWAGLAGPPPYAGNVPAVSGAFIAAVVAATSTLALSMTQWLATKVLVE